MYAIKTDNLTKNYGRARGIENLSLSVENGAVFGFIGPNGAGKSTTLRTLLGLIFPTSGEATVLGMDFRTHSKEILSRTGYMPGEAVFYPSMRVGEVISLSAALHGGSFSEAAKKLCERFELDPKKKIDELSLGNRKKVSIVCAFQHSPLLYLLDEPTSGLDPLIKKEFFDLIHERNSEGATILLSSHVLSEVSRHCSRAAIIRNGSLIASGTIEELSRTSAKRVRIFGTDKAPDIEGVRAVESGAFGVSFLYSGKLPLLINSLQGLDIDDITITEPDLEEVFLHYYEKEGALK